MAMRIVWRITLALSLFLLNGCAAMLYTSIDESVKPPTDWPQLAVIKHYVSPKEMRDVCSKYGAAAGIVACAEPDLDAKTCDIWLVKEFPDAYVEWHEEMHCKGYDHPNGTEINRLIEEYRAHKG